MTRLSRFLPVFLAVSAAACAARVRDTSQEAALPQVGGDARREPESAAAPPSPAGIGEGDALDFSPVRRHASDWEPGVNVKRNDDTAGARPAQSSPSPQPEGAGEPR